MKIRVQKGTILTGETVNVDDIIYVVCYDDGGTPLVVIEQVGNEVVQITRAKEPEFDHILARLGHKLAGVTS